MSFLQKIAAAAVLLLIARLCLAQQDGSYMVGGDYDYPPYSFIDENGRHVGRDVDILKELSELTGLDFKYRFDVWDSSLNLLKKGDIDILTGVIFSPERDLIYDFSIPLNTEYYAIFANKNLQYNDLTDLKGKRLIALSGDIANEKFLQPMGLFTNYQFAKSLPEAIFLIESGRFDYVAAPYLLGNEIIRERKFKNVVVKDAPILPSIYCLAVRENNRTLLSAINKGIGELKASGRLEKINAKWINYNREKTRYKTIIAYSVIILSIALSLVFIFSLWTISLKKQVTIQTGELKKSRDEAEKAHSIKSSFISNVSHEVRSPLHAALGYVSLLQRSILNAEQSGYTRKLTASLKLISELINNVLDISSIEAGMFTLRNEPFDLSKTLAFVRSVVGIMAEKKGLDLVFHVDPQLNHHLIGDSTRLTQVLINLCVNAVKYTDKGRVELSATYENNHEGFSVLKFTIKDTGIGIEEKLRDKIFSRFEHFSEGGEHESSGLGLAIASELIKKMEGRLWFHSSTSKGSVFYFTARFKNQDQIKRPVDAQLVMQKKCVLLVNSGSEQLPVLKEMIEILGMDFRILNPCAQPVAEIIREVGDYMPGIVIFEPGKANPEVVEMLEQATFAPAVIAVVDQLSQHSAIYRASSEINRIIEKPALFYEVLDAINQVIGSLADNKSCSGDHCRCFSEANILLADDDVFSAETLSEMLALSGFQVVTVRNGREAINMIMRNKTELAVLDIQMPVMDGYAAVKRIRQMGIDIPVFAISAFTSEQEKQKCLDSGFNEYFEKPINYEMLFDALRKYCCAMDAPGLAEGALKIIDEKTGLRHFDDVELYKKGLKRFHRLYCSMPDDLESAFRKNNLAIVRTSIHNIASAAGMIGALQLSAYAKGNEKKMIETGFVNETDLRQVIGALNAVLNHISEQIRS